MKVSAFFLSPWKRGGSLPMALMLAAATMGCSTAAVLGAGPPAGGPPVPPPRSPIAILRGSSSSFTVRGC